MDKKKLVIGVIGPGTAPETTIAALYEDFGMEAPKTAE